MNWEYFHLGKVGRKPWICRKPLPISFRPSVPSKSAVSSAEEVPFNWKNIKHRNDLKKL